MGKGSEGYEIHEASSGCQSLSGISIIKESYLDPFFITPRNPLTNKNRKHSQLLSRREK